VAGRFGFIFVLLLSVLLAGVTGRPAHAASAAGSPSAGATAGDHPVANDFRIGGDDKQTRFVLDLSEKIDLHAFTLADPYRVVVDLPQVNFQLPARAGEKGRGLIKAFRFGLVMAGGSRIVLDVQKPVRIEKAFVLDGRDGQPARLVLDLAATDRDTFLRNISIEKQSLRVKESPREAAINSNTSDPRPIVVVDPGHGGIDTGTKSAQGDMEKTMVLEFGLLLRDALERTGKYRVAMTRTDDTFVPLAERVRFARERQAALFISIHADWLPRREGDVQGATIYTLSEKASDAEAARLAEDENRSDAIAGIDLSAETNEVADILIDLAQRETKSFSVTFARQLVQEMRPVMRLHREPVKSAGFRVLKAPDVPSVLIELGYVSNREDLKMLNSAAWREKAVSSIVAAIGDFFARRLAGGGGPGVTGGTGSRP
jgi:N-acetylmuramoyl-L-alanine amidase